MYKGIYEYTNGFEDEEPNEIKTMDVDDHIYNNKRPIMPCKKNGAGDQHSVSCQWWKRYSGAAAGCLGLLCVLLLAGIIGLFLYQRDQLQTSYNTLTKERDQLQTSYNTLTKERDQLQTSYNTLTKERDQLQTSNNTLIKERDQLQTSNKTPTKERDQLQTSYNTLIKERDQLQTSYNTLTKERDQLQTSYNTLIKERDQLQTSNNNLTAERDHLHTSSNNLTDERDQLQTTNNTLIKERDQLQTSYNTLTKERDQLKTSYNTLIKERCPQDWIRSCCSCYYISTNEKTWDLSRKDCQARGANLVIINSREEQALIKAFNKRAWFGLTDKEVEGTWRWVDGTPLTTSYWNKGEPNDFEGEDCALVDNTLKDPVVAWNDVPCNHKNGWICERQLC
ncbi:C-type lectin domain family 4 member M-like [Oncorhynchus clarkii lewisi]|uniref:C-type lectin domain family 4 member M-like n=1 Tax=Oncorhynchus clarkii lewisi TaxID=490388 RepID=UPI0039B9B298